jgi:hypothetical protein
MAAVRGESQERIRRVKNQPIQRSSSQEIAP